MTKTHPIRDDTNGRSSDAQPHGLAASVIENVRHGLDRIRARAFEHEDAPRDDESEKENARRNVRNLALRGDREDELEPQTREVAEVEVREEPSGVLRIGVELDLKLKGTKSENDHNDLGEQAGEDEADDTELGIEDEASDAGEGAADEDSDEEDADDEDADDERIQDRELSAEDEDEDEDEDHDEDDLQEESLLEDDTDEESIGEEDEEDEELAARGEEDEDDDLEARAEDDELDFDEEDDEERLEGADDTEDETADDADEDLEARAEEDDEDFETDDDAEEHPELRSAGDGGSVSSAATRARDDEPGRAGPALHVARASKPQPQPRPATRSQADRVIRIAKHQIGFREGKNNHTKFAAELIKRKIAQPWWQNQPWCETFLAWAFVEAGYRKLAPMTPGCATAVAWFRARKRVNQYPAIGAQVFFGRGGGEHVGLVYKYDPTHIWTVEATRTTTVRRKALASFSRSAHVRVRSVMAIQSTPKPS